MKNVHLKRVACIQSDCVNVVVSEIFTNAYCHKYITLIKFCWYAPSIIAIIIKKCIYPTKTIPEQKPVFKDTMHT